MAEVKDKIVTVESLSSLHEHNKSTYMTKVDPTGSGSLSINRKADTTVGMQSVAIGFNTEASAYCAYAEGDSTVASELDAHAEGRGTIAAGKHSHAQGIGTIASGTGSHAEGTGTVAEGMYCHAEGASTIAKGYQTHAEGTGTIAAGSDQHVHGRYNIESPYQYITVIGNGKNDGGTITRSNAHTLDWNGNAWFAGDIYVGGTSQDNGTRLVDLIYPVGSIYMAVNATNPSTLFGGTWEQLKDRFLLGAGETYSAGTTGGAAEHTLTVDELPKHNHGAFYTGDADSSIKTLDWYTTAGTKVGYQSMETGGNQPHNNMPPYLTVYMWKRIA